MGLSIRGSRTKRSQNVHFRAIAQVDPCRGRRSHRSTAATGRWRFPHYGKRHRPVASLVRSTALGRQGSACRTMSEALFAVIIMSDDRGRPDELSVRDVSVDDTRQGRSPAEHPPSLRMTLLPITIDASRRVQQGSDSSVSRANRELQLPRKSSHHAPSTGLTAQAMARSLWASGELGLS